MEPQEGGGFQDNCGPDQPARAHEEGTHARDDAISEVEVGRTLPGPIEDQQLLLDEQGLGHHGTRAARTGEPSDCRQEVEKEDDQLAHGTIVTSERNPGKANELGIRHAHG